ncbi:cobalamin biosynthesis protein CobQ [Rhodobacterales bacterium HKCCE3408]|nr:cobalamin biosynthesis protein CobQ [Rhodobacterales bacterium HKCCE3408]
MNTPAHLLIGAALFSRREVRGTLPSALLGGLAPDLSLYVMAGVSLAVMDIPPSRVFGELYFSDAWQRVFAVDNSVFVWGAILGLALWRRWPALVAFAGAGLVHLACDFPFHHDDGRAHFWPLTRWIFDSPLSYWDMRHGAGVIGPLEVLTAVTCGIAVCLRYRIWPVWVVMALLMALELRTVIGWFRFLA